MHGLCEQVIFVCVFCWYQKSVLYTKICSGNQRNDNYPDLPFQNQVRISAVTRIHIMKM